MRAVIILVLLLLIPTACAYSGFSSVQRFTLSSQQLSFADGENSKTITLSATDGAIYNTYYASLAGDGKWTPHTFSGAPSTSWITTGSASASVTIPRSASTDNYIITYSCSRVSSAWDCHDGWQIRQVNASISSTEPAATHYLVQDGVGRADIVVSPSAPNMVGLAAEYFQDYIEQMTGATLMISSTPSPSYDFHIYIGRSSYTDALGITAEGCRDGGFRTASGADYLVLIGDDEPLVVLGPHSGPPQNKNKATLYAEWDTLTGEKWGNDYIDYYSRSYNPTHGIWETDGRGSMNAVHEFLYSQGVRWYYPGALGTIIPEREDVSFQDVNALVNPDYSLRYFYMYSKNFFELTSQYGDSEDQLRWLMSLRSNSYWEFMNTIAHGIEPVISRQETKAEHPEYYAIWNGVRMNGDSPAPDLCSEELLEQNVRYVKAIFDTYDVPVVSVMPTDGFVKASESSAACKARETPERGSAGVVSDYVWEYVNNLAWEIYEDQNYAGKKITCTAYGGYSLPPLQLSRPLAPNLIVRMWRSNSADEDKQEQYKAAVNDWLALLPAKQLHITADYLENAQSKRTKAVPCYFPHAIAESLQFLKGKSLGELLEIYTVHLYPDSAWDPFAATSFNAYVTARLYWDAEQDIDELLEEYYTLYYGPARAQMKAFVEYSEANYEEALEDPAVIPTMRAMLSTARAAAGNTIYGQRVDLLIDLMNSVGTGEAEIDSCQTLNTAATTYKLTTDVTSTGTCFLITTDVVTLDCQGHTITYGTGGGSEVHAVYTPYDTKGYATTTVKNCNIVYGSSGGYHTDPVHITSDGLTMTDNTIIDATGTWGTTSLVWLLTSSNINVTGNTLTSKGGTIPLNLDTVSGGTVFDNTFSSVSGNGAYLSRTTDVTMTGNDVSSVSGNGIYIRLGGNNTFTDNRFASVTGSGVREYQTSGNTFVGNTVLP